MYVTRLVHGMDSKAILSQNYMQSELFYPHTFHSKIAEIQVDLTFALDNTYMARCSTPTPSQSNPYFQCFVFAYLNQSPTPQQTIILECRRKLGNIAFPERFHGFARNQVCKATFIPALLGLS